MSLYLCARFWGMVDFVCGFVVGVFVSWVCRVFGFWFEGWLFFLGLSFCWEK